MNCKFQLIKLIYIERLKNNAPSYNFVAFFFFLVILGQAFDKEV